MRTPCCRGAVRHVWSGPELTTSVVKNALTIPINALQQNNQGQFVYVVGADNRVAIRPVEVAQRLHAAALITKGLEAGETVVVQGQYRLTPGTLVVAGQPSDAANPTPASAGDAALNLSSEFIRRPIATALMMVNILLALYSCFSDGETREDHNHS